MILLTRTELGGLALPIPRAVGFVIRHFNELAGGRVSGAKPRASRLNGLSAATDEVWEVRNDR